MFLTIEQYINSIRAINTSGEKDKKIESLIEYYDKYNKNIKAGPGVFYAVIYARYSSHGQREESIEGQVREDLEYAEKNNMIVMGVYVDKALTGKTDTRDGFQRMIKDAAKRKWQYVICWKLDRFARNRYDSARYKAKLKEYNVRVVSAREYIPDGPEGILLESVLEGQAEYYSASLRENVRRGMTDNALECISNGGNIPFGFATVKKRYVLDPEKAPIAKRLYQMYNTGSTIKELVNYLDRLGIRSNKGNKITINGVKSILSNPKYMGVYKFKDTYTENAIPKIVEKELFEAVQKKLYNRSSKRRCQKGSVEFLLTTKLYCGKCGMGMTGDSGTSRHGDKYYYYTCIGKKRDHSCDKKSVPKDWLENLVINETVQTVLQDEVIERIADIVIDFQNRETENQVIVGLKNKLKEVDKSIKNLLAAIEQGIITPSTKVRVEELEIKKNTLEHSIMEESLKTPALTREQIIFFLEKFKNGDISDQAYRHKLIDTFVNSVYVYDDHLVITYNYSSTKNKTTLEEINAVFNDSDFVPRSNSSGGNNVRIKFPMAHQKDIHRIGGCLFLVASRRREQHGTLSVQKRLRGSVFSCAGRVPDGPPKRHSPDRWVSFFGNYFWGRISLHRNFIIIH